MERALLERASAAANSDASAQTLVLEMLVRVVEATMDGASPDLEERVGLKPGQLRTPGFKDGTVRAYAIRKIAGMDDPAALSYLLNLKKSDTEPDPSGQVWAAVQIAIREAQFRRIPDEWEKTRFLERTKEDRSAAAFWAVEELCNRGSYSSVSFVRASIRSSESGPDAETDIQFCEARMDVISRDPDRVKALASILSVNSGSADSRLLGWAIGQLQAMKSPRADAELNRYVNDSLPAGSPLIEKLAARRFQIRREPPPLPTRK